MNYRVQESMHWNTFQGVTGTQTHVQSV